MKGLNKWLPLVLLIILPQFSLAQDSNDLEIDFSGQIRVRSELIDPDFNEETDPYDVSLLRTRVNMKASFSDKMSAFVQLQDSRMYGDFQLYRSTDPTLVNTGNVDLHQAWFKINRLFWKWLSVKGGRLELDYDNGRLIGAEDWHNVGRVFDGGVTTLTFDPIEIDLFSTIQYESEQAADEYDGDQTFAGIYARTHFLKEHTLNFYLLGQMDAQQDPNEDPQSGLGTLGIYFNGKFGKFRTDAEMAFQGGTDHTGLDKVDIAAFMLALQGEYHFGDKRNSFLGLGVDVLSGDDPTTAEYECFNTLFASNHAHYGAMDYFVNIAEDTDDRGLADVYLTGGIDIHRQVRFKGDMHFFSAAEDEGLDDSDFGSELDLTFIYHYLDNVTMDFGLSVFAPGELWKTGTEEDPATWGYSRITVNF